MRLKSVYREYGLIGVIFGSIRCFLVGHDFIGQRCLYCHEPKKR